MPRASLPAAFLISTLLSVAGCGTPNPAEQADAAQTALSQGDFATARAKAKAALADPGVAANKALAWKLERIGLESDAGEGKGQEVLSGIERLSAAFPTQVNAELYFKLGNRLADSGDATGALDLVDAGKKRFHDHAEAFDQLLETLKAKAVSGGDSALAVKLRGMGYL